LTVQASVANLNPREEMRNKIFRQHKRIYQAVMARKPEAAQRIAMAHVRFVSDAMREIEQQGTAIIRTPLNSPASTATAT
ncbi:MAG: FCD domain-containing protein, partial [Marinobacter sp.]